MSDFTIGRLFYTVEERKIIDSIRYSIKDKKRIEEEVVVSHDESVDTAKKEGELHETSVTIEGYITREDGNNVIWYNNKNTLGSDHVNKTIKFISHSIGSDEIHIISNQKKLILKPGQSVNLSSGEIQEKFKKQDTSAIMKIEKQ